MMVTKRSSGMVGGIRTIRRKLIISSLLAVGIPLLLFAYVLASLLRGIYLRQLEQELRSFLEQHRKRIEVTERRAAEAQRGRERLEQAREGVSVDLAISRDTRELPSALDAFINQYTAHHLTQVVLREGKDSPRYDEAINAVTALLVWAGGAAAHAIRFPGDATGWAGLAGLTVFYCIAMISLFFVLPRLPSTHTAALNIEPIALLFLAWLVLGHTLTPLQIAGAFLTVGAIVWLGLSKR